jgi:hypothetical protein
MLDTDTKPTVAITLSQALTVIPAVALTAGIVHDWGLFVGARSQLLTVLTIQDHLNTAAAWLPGAIIGWALGFAFLLPDMTRAIEGQKPLFSRLLRLIGDQWAVTFGSLVFLLWFGLFAPDYAPAGLTGAFFSCLAPSG